jgi:hypothetical protein
MRTRSHRSHTRMISLRNVRRKMLFALQGYNRGTTPPHMKVGPSMWSPPHVREYCAPVVQITSLILDIQTHFLEFGSNLMYHNPIKFIILKNML